MHEKGCRVTTAAATPATCAVSSFVWVIQPRIQVPLRDANGEYYQ